MDKQAIEDLELKIQLEGTELAYCKSFITKEKAKIKETEELIQRLKLALLRAKTKTA